jgi:transcriptional regulator with XRE-family HTH domain
MTLAHSETPEHVRSTLGAVLRRHRELGERSLQEIAEPAGISTAYLSEVERGQKDISTDRLLKVAGALEITVADLYLELARELGARDSLPSSWVDNPRAQVQAMCRSLEPDALRTVARFSTFLAMSQGPPKRRIGFLEEP